MHGCTSSTIPQRACFLLQLAQMVPVEWQRCSLTIIMQQLLQFFSIVIQGISTLHLCIYRHKGGIPNGYVVLDLHRIMQVLVVRLCLLFPLHPLSLARSLEHGHKCVHIANNLLATHCGILPLQFPLLWHTLILEPSKRCVELQMQKAMDPGVTPLQQTMPPVIRALPCSPEHLSS